MTNGWNAVADYRPALTLRDDKTVSIDGRLIPPVTYSKEVLVLLSGKTVRLDKAAQVDGSDGIVWCTYGSKVTHWMNVPNVPCYIIGGDEYLKQQKEN